MTIAEAAKKWGVTYQCVRKWVVTKRVPAVGPSRSYKIPDDAQRPEPQKRGPKPRCLTASKND